MFAEKLKEQLNNCAPDWEWSCVSDETRSPDKISPRMMSVSAINKLTGVRTSAIQVSNTPAADVRQAAQFICDVLMIHPAEAALPGSAVFKR